MATHIYQHALKGFAAPMSPKDLAKVQKHPKFKFIEEDQIMHAYQGCTSQTQVPSWGLPRISERDMSLDDTYAYPVTSGQGVTAYIIDTGIMVTHNDFEGRASFGFKATPSWSNTDGHGHGTHVASTVSGKLYGVTKQAMLVAVKVLGDDGSGTNAGVIAGVDWSTGHYRQSGKPGVANLSLGGGFSAALNTAVTNAMKAGLFTVVAAGNSNADACNYSPSSAKDVITVGSSDSSPSQTDVRSYFSNYGSCTDIFAPGSDIAGAWIGSNTATRTISGTSMASPHVCGVAALILGTNPNVDWIQLTAIITSSTPTKGVIDLQCGNNAACAVSPNLMVFNGCSH